MPKHNLTRDELNQLDDALADVLERNAGESWRNGSHFILIHLLSQFGFSTNSSEQAEKKAKEILYGHS